MISVLSPETESKPLPFGQKFPESVGGSGEAEMKELALNKISVSRTEVAPNLDTPGRKRRGRLKKLILRGAQSWRFCCYKLTQSLLLPVTSAPFSVT